jgi:hypothetical protein
VVLPWSTWAMIATLRILVCLFVIRAPRLEPYAGPARMLP